MRRTRRRADGKLNTATKMALFCDDDPLSFVAVGRISLHRRNRIVVGPGLAAQLSFIESRLLETLMERPGQALSRDQLACAIWGEKARIGDRTIDVTIGRLRRALGPLKFSILTLRGIGYCFIASDRKPRRRATNGAAQAPSGDAIAAFQSTPLSAPSAHKRPASRSRGGSRRGESDPALLERPAPPS